MGVLLGLVAAVGWGTADFLARYATRSIGSYRTLLFMQFFGLIGLSIILVGMGGWRGAAVGWEPWACALLAALLNILGSLALYRSFEVGILTIVSPVAASYAALTTILSVLSGEVLSPLHTIGIAAALLGVVLASTPLGTAASDQAVAQRRDEKKRAGRGLGWAIVAALGFGVTYWLLGFRVTPALGPIIPVWLIRLTTPCALTACARPLRQSLSIPRGRVWWYLTGVGVLDTCAFVANTLGLSLAPVALVSVLASLFSSVTVLLAAIFLRERLHWLQWVGIGVIIAGVALVNT